MMNKHSKISDSLYPVVLLPFQPTLNKCLFHAMHLPDFCLWAIALELRALVNLFVALVRELAKN